MFAKLFEISETGQVLIMLDRDNETQKPKVSVFTNPPELGVCNIAYSFSDTDEGWDNAENFLDSFDRVKALEYANIILNLLN